MRAMLAPALASLNRDAFVSDVGCETLVDLEGRPAPSDLYELALDDGAGVDAA
jgi:hypothetical protein